jgi:hypothetical protein
MIDPQTDRAYCLGPGTRGTGTVVPGCNDRLNSSAKPNKPRVTFGTNKLQQKQQNPWQICEDNARWP